MIAFKVVTPKGEYLKQEVKSIHVKTVVGETTILPNHMPIFASLVPCKLVLKNENDEEEIYAISGGFLQFNKNEGMILADAIEGKKDIDLERAKKSMERAKERLEKKDSNTNLKRAQLSLERAINRYVNLLMGEIPRLSDDANGYGPNGKNYIAHVDIPENVKIAFEELKMVFGSEIRAANPLYATNMNKNS